MKVQIIKGDLENTYNFQYCQYSAQWTRVYRAFNSPEEAEAYARFMLKDDPKKEFYSINNPDIKVIKEFNI